MLCFQTVGFINVLGNAVVLWAFICG